MEEIKKYNLNHLRDLEAESIYVLARDPEDTLASGNALLVVAMARARNTDMTFNDSEDAVLEKGRSPIRLEPVKATIKVARPEQARVTG